MTSVIYVDLSSDSEEEGPPDVKRARRDQSKVSTAKSLPTKLLQIPKTSISSSTAGLKVAPSATVTAAGTGTVVGSYRSMHIPSGITVTKHNNSNGNFNMSNAKITVENNNNNNSSNNNNNNNVNKPFKLASGIWSKTASGTTMATITSVPSPQKVVQKPATQQQKAPNKQRVSVAPTQKHVLMQQQQQKLQKPSTNIQQMSQQRTSTLNSNIQQLQQQPKSALQLQQQQPQKSTLQFQQQQQQQKAVMSSSVQQQQQQKVALTTPMLQSIQQQKLTTPTSMPQQPKLVTSTSMMQQQRQTSPSPLLHQQKPSLSMQLQQQQQTTSMSMQVTKPALTSQKSAAQLQRFSKPPLQQQQQHTQPNNQQLALTKLSMKPKVQTTQRLPTLQKMPPAGTLTSHGQVQPKAAAAQKLPPPAHSGNSSMIAQNAKQLQQSAASLAPPPPAHHATAAGSGASAQQLGKLSPTMPTLIRQNAVQNTPTYSSSAARTMPYKMRPAISSAALTPTTATTTISAVSVSTTAVTTTTTAATATAITTTTSLRNVHSNSIGNSCVTTSTNMTAGATPPLRLLATPPHCAAALNEPLLLNLPPTTSITPQLTPTTTPPPVTASATAAKISFPGASISPVPKPAAKRVQPITVLKKSDEEWRRHIAQQQLDQCQKSKKPASSSSPPTIVLVESPPTTPPTEKVESNEQAKDKSPPAAVAPAAAATQATATMAATKASSAGTRAPIVPEYASLLQLCRELDKSPDMERVIEVKLLKYYHSVHENFVRSRGFRKQLEQTMERMRNEPDMVYVHLKCVVDELKVRRKAKVVELPPDEVEEKSTAASLPAPAAAEIKPTETVVPAAAAATATAAETAPKSPTLATPSTGNKRTDERIRKLNRTLYTITKRISALEEADVDWNDDDDSSYLQVERYKKRACQIYEKICDLTGESKNAHRQMKQPILFKDTPYPQFNRTLSAFVNRMHAFPDYHDVLQLLEHCNKEKNLGLATFEMKRIAHDAFVKVGRLLQARRKIDLYETVTHFTANAKDPAASDSALLAKLHENNKKKTNISDILEKFAREQDLTAEEQREARLKQKKGQATARATEATESATATSVKAEMCAVGDAPAQNYDERPCTSAQAAQAAQAQAVQTAPPCIVTNGLVKHPDSGNENDSDSEDDDDDDDDEDETDDDVDAFVDNFKQNGDISDAESDTEANAPPKTSAAAAAHVIVNNVTRVKTAASSPEAANKDNDNLDNIKDGAAVTELPNGKLKDVPGTHVLKVISVSSLNATVSATNNNNNNSNSNTNNNNTNYNNTNNNNNNNSIISPEQPQQQQKQQQIIMDTEIIISDEESMQHFVDAVENL